MVKQNTNLNFIRVPYLTDSIEFVRCLWEGAITSIDFVTILNGNNKHPVHAVFSLLLAADRHHGRRIFARTGIGL